MALKLEKFRVQRTGQGEKKRRNKEGSKTKKQNDNNKSQRRKHNTDDNKDENRDPASSSKGKITEEKLRQTVAESIMMNGHGSAKKSVKSNLSFVESDDGTQDASQGKSRQGSYTMPEKKKGPGKNSAMNVERLLKAATANHALLANLKNSQDPADRKAAEEAKWDKIERKAAGERVPEPKHLKAKLKMLQKKKEKSKKEWAARIQSVEKDKEERYDKRDANIKKKRDQRIETKLKRKGIVLPEDPEAKRAKKLERGGRKRSGFEGRHSGFLNDDGNDDDRKKAKKGKKLNTALVFLISSR